MSLISDQSRLKRWYKEINWGVHRRLAEDIFHEEILRAEQNGFFEQLYVSVNDNDRQIQLAAGNHPAGPLPQKFDLNGRWCYLGSKRSLKMVGRKFRRFRRRTPNIVRVEDL